MPAPEKVVSGTKGTVKKGAAEVANVAMWSLTPTITVGKHGSNSTEGWKGRSSGTRDATGKLKIWLVNDAGEQGAPEELILGELYDLELHTDDSGNNYYSGEFMIEGMGTLEVDMDDGKEMSVEYTIGPNGKITENGKVPKLNEPAGP